MTRERIESVLARIDVSSFPIPVVLGVSNCGTKVSAALRAPDARLKVQTGVKAGGLWPPHSVLVMGDGDADVVRAAKWAIVEALTHEVDEHLQVDGCLFTNPHPEAA